MTNQKVALIAVAKDEDTYLHEWIHHHLYVGFSPILIGVNRITDRTNEVLNAITKKQKDVKVFNIDWIDQTCIGLNKRIQNIAYAYLSAQIDQNAIDFVSYLDIDEFWFNVEQKTIQNFIHKHLPFDIASFFWLCQMGEECEFSPPFKQVKYNICGPVKSLIKTSLINKVEFFTYHIPSFREKIYRHLDHIDQLGNDISCLNPNKKFNRQKPFIDNSAIINGVLHRMMRSQKEYLSLVFRGRPNGELIKSNGRHGFVMGEKNLSQIYDDNYYSSLNCFIETRDLQHLLIESRVKKLQYFQSKLQKMTAHQLIQESDNAIDALKGTSGLEAFIQIYFLKIKDEKYHKDFKLKLTNAGIELKPFIKH